MNKIAWISLLFIIIYAICFWSFGNYEFLVAEMAALVVNMAANFILFRRIISERRRVRGL